MTDNFQFDKNSKLFQKFLAKKVNKHNESATDLEHLRCPTEENPRKNRSFLDKPKEHLAIKGKSANR